MVVILHLKLGFMMTTYIDGSELNKYCSVEDKDLNDLLQEVRKLTDNKIFLRKVTRTENPLFRKKVVHVYYELLSTISAFSPNTNEVMVINFCQDWEWSINSIVKKSYIVTYLLGMLSGYAYATEKTN